MFFLQAARASVSIRLGNLRLEVPKLELEDVVNWGVSLAEKQNQINTAEMDAQRKQEWMAFYGRMSMSFDEVKRIARTPLGIDFIVPTCLSRAKVFKIVKRGKVEKEEPTASLTADQIAALIKVNGAGRLAGFSWVLADIDDESVLRDPTEGMTEEEKVDPLKLLGRAVSKALPAIGAKS